MKRTREAPKVPSAGLCRRSNEICEFERMTVQGAEDAQIGANFPCAPLTLTVRTHRVPFASAMRLPAHFRLLSHLPSTVKAISALPIPPP